MDSKIQEARVPGILMLPLTGLLMISIYQTAKGSESFFNSFLGHPMFAWALSIGIGIYMMWLAHQMTVSKIQGKPFLGGLVIFFICSVFSYLGNFNSFYTSNQSKILYTNELQEKKDLAKEVTISANKALLSFEPQKHQEVNRILALKNELIMQIQDPANKGCGDRCKNIKVQLENLLGRKLTEFSGSPEQLSQSYGDLIDNEIKQKYQTGNFGKALTLINKNEKNRDEIIANIDEVLSSENSIQQDGSDTIRDSIDKINTIGIETEKLINDSSVYDYQPQTFNNAEIGNMFFSFQSAISNNLGIFIGLSLLSFLIDWLGVIILLYWASNETSLPMRKSKKSKEKVNVL